jgi:molybdopterin molybdotransferase
LYDVVVSEPDVSDLLTVAQAIAIIDGVAVTPRVVSVELGDADGLVLAEAIVADRDYPPFHKSQMDGFAVRAGDVPGELLVVGEIAAGQQAARALADGQAFAIMTGAPMPDGADAVVPVEFVQRAGDRVKIPGAAKAGRFIARRGSDVRAGAVVLEGGTSLGPAQLAVAASVGASRLRVFAKPRVAVMSTGDELVAFDATPGPAQIRDSNRLMIVTLLRRLGCDVIDLGIVRDDPAAVRAGLERGRGFDVLFVTGGMSMGEYDYVPRTLLDMGAELGITKLRIKPGKPFVFGRFARSANSAAHGYVVGLPGNPVSGFVCTARLASRLIARLSGRRPEPRWRTGTLATPLEANGPREFYQPALLDGDGAVTPLAWKGSADLFTLARANALLVRTESEPARPAGAAIRVMEV